MTIWLLFIGLCVRGRLLIRSIRCQPSLPSRVKGAFRCAQRDKPGRHSWTASNPFNPLPTVSPQPLSKGRFAALNATNRAGIRGRLLIRSIRCQLSLPSRVKGVLRCAQRDKPGGHSWKASNPFSPLPAVSPKPPQRGASLHSARQTGRAFVDGF